MSKGGGQSRFLAFWATLPGMLTGLAALITAGVGAFSLWHTLTTGSVTPTPVASPATSTAVPSAVATQGSSSPPTAGLWQGQISLDCNSGANLERGQSGPSISAPDFVWVGPHCEPGQLSMVTSGHLAPVREPVDKQACVSALTASPNTYLSLDALSAGSWVCLETGGGQHVGALHIVAMPAPGARQLTFTYSVYG
jgi:hypothetical protein